MSGVGLMVGDHSIHLTGSFFGNLVALLYQLVFQLIIMIVRKNPNLDMVPSNLLQEFLVI